ncbi:SpaA isopeptide-forming pilin-related protein, partial [Macrococcus capreoli]
TTMADQDTQYQLRDIAVNFEFDKIIKKDKPVAKVQLINTSTQTVVNEITNQKGQDEIVFKDVRVINDEQNKIPYEIKIKLPEGYESTIDEFNVSIKKVEQKTVSTETPTEENPITETLTTEKPTVETNIQPTVESPSESNVTSEDKSNITNNTSTSPVTNSLSLTSVPSSAENVKTVTNAPTLSKVFTLNPLSIRTLTASSPSYRGDPSQQSIPIGTGSGFITLSGKMNPDHSFIAWQFTMIYGAPASKPIWLSNFTTSSGITLPSSVSYTVQSGGNIIRMGTIPFQTLYGGTTASLGTINNNEYVTVTIVTPVTQPNLDTYTLNFKNLVYDEIGNKYYRAGLSTTLTKVSTTPTINTVTYLDNVVTGTADPGDTVTITNASGQILGTATANASGQYTVPIVSQPVGMQLTAVAKHASNLISDPATTTVTGVFQLNLLKVDHQNKPLSNATFALSNGSITLNQTSDSSGNISFSNLRPGTYQLKETTAPTGFILDNTVHNVLIGNDGTITIDNQSISGTYKLINQPILKNVYINVIDGQDGHPLSGATYQIYNVSNQLIQSATSDQTGKITFSNLPFGNYRMVQTKAPTGYNLESNEQTVTMNGSDVTLQSPQYNMELPDTGGSGIVIFVITGSVLMLLACLIRKLN